MTERPPRSRSRRTLRWLRLNPELVAGCSLILGWIVIAAFAPLIAPHDPASTSFAALKSPGGANPFGTDRLGHDVFSRVLFAPRTDLYLAVSGTLIALAVGVLIAVPVGYTRRWWGDVVMRLFDGFQAFPVLILALALVQALGQGSGTIIASLAIINVPLFVRVVRGQVLSLREQRFVEAAVAAGNPTRRILFRHILPNATVPILAQATISIAYAILIVAALSFLSVGIKPPTAEWGQMISDGYQSLTTGQWWIAIFPGLAVVTVVLGFHLVGDGLQRAFAIQRRG